MTPSNPVAATLLVHAGFVQRLARGLAGPDGDDLAQDTWTAALQAPVADVHSLRAWLATIAANLWRNGQRTVSRRVRREAGARMADDCPSVLEILEREEVRRHVVTAVVELPQRLRRVVLLRFYEGLDSFAIGRRLDVPASTVRAQLQQALALLRLRLDGAHDDRRAAWALPLAGWLKAPVSSWFGTLLRVVWPVRAVFGAVALLLLTWLTSPLWLGSPISPPAPQVGSGDLAVADRENLPEGTASTRERVGVAAAAEEAVRGPGDLWGRVVAAADGAPISGAEVVLEHREADEIMSLDPDYDNRIEILGHSRTDSEGRFAFRVQRAFQHRFAVRAAGYVPVVEAWCTGGSEFVVQLDRATFLEGTVRRRVDGTPLADWLVEAVVRAGFGGAGDGVQTRTGADGGFFLAGVPPKTCYVSVRPSGQRPLEMQLVTPEPGKGARVEFLVDDGCSVRGVVRDEATRQPIAGAEIAPNWARRHAVRSAADGSYEMSGLGERESLHVRAEGYADQVLPVTSVAEQIVIDIVLSRGATVVGRVVDRDGRAPTGVYAAAAAEALPPATSYTLWRTARIAADGRFRIDGLAVASTRQIRWQLLARAPGHGARVLALPAIQQQGAVLDVGDVVLQPQGMLEGRLVDSSGGAAVHAEVMLMGQASDFGRLLAAGVEPGEALFPFAERETRTGGDGSFRFAGLAAGSYTVRARLEGKVWVVRGGPFAVHDGDILTVPDLVADAGLTIEGTLRITGLRELHGRERFRLTAKPTNGGTRNWAIAAIGMDGSFRLERLEVGDYTLAAINEPAGFAVVPKRSVAAGTRNVELVLVVADVIEGRVVDHENKPVRRASMYFVDEGRSVTRTFSTDAAGRFRIEVPPGILGTVWASHPEVMMRQGEQRDVAAGTRDLVLKLPR